MHFPFKERGDVLGLEAHLGKVRNGHRSHTHPQEPGKDVVVLVNGSGYPVTDYTAVVLGFVVIGVTAAARAEFLVRTDSLLERFPALETVASLPFDDLVWHFPFVLRPQILEGRMCHARVYKKENEIFLFLIILPGKG